MTRDSLKPKPDPELRQRVADALRTISHPVTFADWITPKLVRITSNRNMIDVMQRLLPKATVIRFGFTAAMPEHVREVGHGAYFIELDFSDGS